MRQLLSAPPLGTRLWIWTSCFICLFLENLKTILNPTRTSLRRLWDPLLIQDQLSVSITPHMEQSPVFFVGSFCQSQLLTYRPQRTPRTPSPSMPLLARWSAGAERQLRGNSCCGCPACCQRGPEEEPDAPTEPTEEPSGPTSQHAVPRFQV